MSNRKIFLTGSNGYVGSNLLKHIEANKSMDVSVLKRETLPYSDTGALTMALEGTDVICHIGGLIKGTSEELLEANTKNTLFLLEAIRPLKKKPHVIFASSFAVYALQPHVITEKTKILPRNYYGLSKRMAEEQLLLYASQEQIPVTILRIANVYGPYMAENSPSVISYIQKSIQQGTPLKLNGDGTQMRDFIYVDDVVSAFMLSVNRENHSGSTVLNICSGVGTSINEIFSLLSEKFDKKVDVIFNEQVREEGLWVGEFTKAKNELNWIPSVSIKKGIRFL